MKVITKIIYSLCICFSFMSYPCTSHQASEQGDKVGELTMPLMPRKLKVNEEAMVNGYGKKGTSEPLFNKQGVTSSETKEINAKKGNQGELDEAIEAEYFTMDYKNYKKRRPIHNKSQLSAEASP